MSTHATITLPSTSIAHNWKPPGSGSPRAILILQHGFGEYAERYETSHTRLIPHLTERNIDVWALDLEGHGQSPGEKGRGVVDLNRAVMDHSWLVRFVAGGGAAAVENEGITTTTATGAIKNSNGNKQLPIFLFGHSLGGLVTAASANALLTPAALSASQTSSKNQPENHININGVILSSPVFPFRPNQRVIAFFASLILPLLAYFLPCTEVPFPATRSDTLCGDKEQIQLAAEDPLIFHGQISWTVAATAVDVVRELWRGVRGGIWSGKDVGVFVFHGRWDCWADWTGSKDFVEEVQQSRSRMTSRAETEIGEEWKVQVMKSRVRELN